MRETLLLDTHVWIWFLFDDPALGAKNRQFITEAQPLISSISVYEAGYKITRGRWRGIAPGLWPEILAALPVSGIEEAAPDAALFRIAAALDWDHGDPGDRLLVAEARRRNVPIMTKDRVIRESALVETVWL